MAAPESADHIVESLLARQVSTPVLLREAMQRPDLMQLNGYITGASWDMADRLVPRFCVDGAPFRMNDDGEVEAMAIVRNTGRFAGKLCLVGGGVGQVKDEATDRWVPQSVEEALRDHFRTDLGREITLISGSWHRPDYLAQDMRPDENGNVRPGFQANYGSRHLLANRWAVEFTDDGPFVFGATTVGGQEVAGVEWFTRDQMPPDEAFGYRHDETYRALFEIATPILVARQQA